MICISCEYEHNGQYCPKCGEKAGTQRIRFVSILEESISTIAVMDKGFLFNVKNLALNPKQFINSYLKGKRKSVFNPLSFFLVSITLYILAQLAFKELFSDSLAFEPDQSNRYNSGYLAGRFIYIHLDYFWGLSLIWLSVSTKLLFQQFNFAEHLTINAFIIGQATLIGILVYPVFQIPVMFDPLVYLIIIIMLFRFYYKSDDTSVIVVKSVFSIIIFSLLIVAATLGIAKMLQVFDITI